MPIRKRVLRADDFLPDKNWSALASTAYTVSGRASIRSSARTDAVLIGTSHRLPVVLVDLGHTGRVAPACVDLEQLRLEQRRSPVERRRDLLRTQV